jgi:hypothetical protein
LRFREIEYAGTHRHRRALPIEVTARVSPQRRRCQLLEPLAHVWADERRYMTVDALLRPDPVSETDELLLDRPRRPTMKMADQRAPSYTYLERDPRLLWSGSVAAREGGPQSVPELARYSGPC